MFVVQVTDAVRVYRELALSEIAAEIAAGQKNSQIPGLEALVELADTLAARSQFKDEFTSAICALYAQMMFYWAHGYAAFKGLNYTGRAINTKERPQPDVLRWLRANEFGLRANDLEGTDDLGLPRICLPIDESSIGDLKEKAGVVLPEEGDFALIFAEDIALLRDDLGLRCLWVEGLLAEKLSQLSVNGQLVNVPEDETAAKKFLSEKGLTSDTDWYGAYVFTQLWKTEVRYYLPIIPMAMKDVPNAEKVKIIVPKRSQE